MSHPLERQIIEQARALIATPDTWAQGEFARDAEGRAISWRSPLAVRFCLWGALNRAAYAMTGDRRQAIALADRAAKTMRARFSPTWVSTPRCHSNRRDCEGSHPSRYRVRAATCQWPARRLHHRSSRRE